MPDHKTIPDGGAMDKNLMLPTGALTREEKMMNQEQKITQELQAAETYLSSHPVLNYSPGDLKRLNREVKEYLQEFTISEQELYRSYYSGPLSRFRTE